MLGVIYLLPAVYASYFILMSRLLRSQHSLNITGMMIIYAILLSKIQSDFSN